MSTLVFGLMAGAGLCGGAAAALVVAGGGERRLRARRRARALDGPWVKAEGDSPRESWVIRYGETLTRQLFSGATMSLSPAARSKRVFKSRGGAWFREHGELSGLAKRMSPSAFCEEKLRLALAGMGAGALVGMVFSSGFAMLLAVVFGVVGYQLPTSAVKRVIRKRALCADEHLSEMLETVALGLRSGLAFDRSFALYGTFFSNGFAHSCTKAYRSWSLGLCTREEALRELAASYDAPQLRRIVDSILRSLHFGSPLAGVLEEASGQARAACKAALEERVAKAPVKMMLPTGTLILPAMLLLVLGPVLLELAGGF